MTTRRNLIKCRLPLTGVCAARAVIGPLVDQRELREVKVLRDLDRALFLPQENDVLGRVAVCSVRLMRTRAAPIWKVRGQAVSFRSRAVLFTMFA